MSANAKTERLAASETANSAAGTAHTLVTGANGFTGQWLMSQLRASGQRVTETVTGNSADETPTRRKLDITSLEDCRRVIDETRPDYLVHLAAISFVGHGDALDFYRVNVLGALNLLQACVDVGHVPRKILMVSSANVYGNVASDAIDENFPLAPVNHYAASKAAMESMVRTWMDKLPILIVRPFNYTGRGQAANFLVPKIVYHFARREKSISLGNLDIARDFSDVRYVARVYEALLGCDVAGETVNVCTGKPFTLKQIVDMATEYTGHRLEVKVAPEFVRATDVAVLAGSPVKLRKLVPQIEPVPFPDTLRWMLQSANS
ncbi:GDP-mannose 4,6-dehydratase [Paraburkholderia sp.]|uniref:GDP-mannose 4,6-dehydratase n=1 Tax=Paraburkholderia sp. TaxID=1926495 RepID=UPI0023A210C8|nr:GDP-mannose 4,6-dehydratase [Paraburkholderia sp.]MDE1183003.1 GDP-mannose 4,6-dehydratase [Paraburkholderia sp.]